MNENQPSDVPPSFGLSSLPRYQPSGVPEARAYPQQYPGRHHDKPFVLSNGKLTAGIVLIVVGALVLLARMSYAGSQASRPDPSATGPIYAATSAVALLLFGIVPLVVGIALVTRSKRRR